MKRIAVGWDVDDVLFGLYPRMHKVARDANLGKAKEVYPQSWFPWEEYDCPKDEWLTVINRAIETGYLYGGDPIPEVVRVMRILDQLGVEQHVITARGFLGHPELVREQTETMLLSHVIPHASLTFTQDKGAAARALDLTHAFDDNVGNFLAISEVGVDTYLWDQPWNQDHIVPLSRRITDPEQVIRIIKRGVSS